MRYANLTEYICINSQSGLYLTECPAGVFGKNCVENCSMTCGDPGVCDKVTGHCNESCLPGWEGDMCQNGNIMYTVLFITLDNFNYIYIIYIYIYIFFLNLELSHAIVMHLR